MVQIKRKVTIKKKSQNEDNFDIEIKSEVTKKNKLWLWILLILVLLGVFILIYYINDKVDRNTVEQGTEQTEVIDKESQLSDEQQNFADNNIADNVSETDEIEDRISVDGNSSVGMSPNNSSISKTESSNRSQDEIISNKTNELKLEGTLEEKAKRVIRGEFGNGQERKNLLGSSYEEIQSKVNEMYRDGLVR